MKIGFIGLGRMGYRIAKHLTTKYETSVYPIMNKKNAIIHSQTYGSKYCITLKELNDNSDIIFTCLPTSKEVNNLVQLNEINNFSSNPKYLIDCTSGDYFQTQKIGELLNEKNIKMLDCPISGGIEKAEIGNLCAMVGGDKEDYEVVKDVLNTFSNSIYVDKLGSAHAVKSINNLLNVSNLCLISEGLNSLQKLGINVVSSLNAINNSSGRSLMSIERIPQDVLTENYNYGFTLGLMKKDVDQAMNIISNKDIFNNIQKIMNSGVNNLGTEVDYTEITKEIFIKNV